MAEPTEAAIYAALVESALDLAETLGLPMDVPNVPFSPPESDGDRRRPYLRMTYMPNTAQLDGLPFDGDVTYEGLVQISVFWAASEGLPKPLRVASQVVQWFSPGTRLERDGVKVEIDEQPQVAAAQQETDLLHVPVTVAWIASRL